MNDVERIVKHGCSCADCNAPYGTDGWCDVIIPDDIWNKIDNGAGVLCFRCMTKRLESSGFENVPVIIASGPYIDANEEWRLIGWDHGHKVAKTQALAAVEVEAEDEGEIPDEIWEAIKDKEDLRAHEFLIIRLTKKSIMERIIGLDT